MHRAFDDIPPRPGKIVPGSFATPLVPDPFGGGPVEIDASQVTYDSASPADWLIPPEQVAQALDELAARPAGTENVGKVSFTYATVSPMILQALAPGSVIDRAAILIETPFNGVGATIELGTAASPGLVFAVGEVDLGKVGTYDDSELFPTVVAELLILTITPGTSTQGSAILVYKVRS
jgi:hypothetical protein